MHNSRPDPLPAFDLVIWDNRATVHRARPFADTTIRRELRRVTTLDVERWDYVTRFPLHD